MSEITRLFVVSCVLVKREPNGSLTIRNPIGYRGTRDGEDAVRGRYSQNVLDENPGFSIAALELLEVPSEHVLTIAQAIKDLHS